MVAGNLFDDLTDFIEVLNTPGTDANAAAHAMKARLDSTMNAINFTLTDIGGRMNTLAQLDLAQEDLGLANQQIIGELKDLDYAEAMSRVAQIELALTATQKTFANINSLSLFDYL
jgi:flagellar hook-associated protein 3 FlgL